MDVNGVSQCRENGSSEPIPHAQGSGGSGCQQQQQQQQQQDGQQDESATGSDSHSQEKRPANDQEDKKRASTTKTSSAPSYSRWSGSQPHQQPGPAVRTYQNSKARVTMSPGFTPQWNNNQSAWNNYTYPRANIHYQSHASYSYCPGHPAIDNAHCILFLYVIIDISPATKYLRLSIYLQNSLRPEGQCRMA